MVIKSKFVGKLVQAFPLAIFFTSQDFKNAEKLSFFLSFEGFLLSLMSKVDPSSRQICGMNINNKSQSMFKMNKSMFLEKKI